MLRSLKPVRRRCVQVCNEPRCLEALSNGRSLSSTASPGHHPMCAPTLNNASMNERVKECKYAVRGRVLDESVKLEARMREGHKYPFDEIVALNIGNPQVSLIAMTRVLLAFVLVQYSL
jgi:hypothetical protein